MFISLNRVSEFRDFSSRSQLQIANAFMFYYVSIVIRGSICINILFFHWNYQIDYKNHILILKVDS